MKPQNSYTTNKNAGQESKLSICTQLTGLMASEFQTTITACMTSILQNCQLLCFYFTGACNATLYRQKKSLNAANSLHKNNYIQVQRVTTCRLRSQSGNPIELTKDAHHVHIGDARMHSLHSVAALQSREMACSSAVSVCESTAVETG